MVNIPSNLQNIWDDVSKDGKIDQSDAKKLLNAAAPGLEGAKTAQEIDTITSKELDDEERAFLQNFSETSKGVVLDVKTGSAKGSFEFVEKQPDKTTSGPKLFEPLKLPESSLKTTDETKVNKTDEDKAVPVQKTEVNDAYTDKIKKLNDLKVSLPKIMSGGDLTRELAKVDGKISKLEENRARDNFMGLSKGLLDASVKSTSDSLIKSKETLVKEFDKLPDSLKNDKDVKETYEKALSKVVTSSVDSFVDELITMVDNGVTEALKTGDIGKLLELKKSLEGLLVKYSSLKDDPSYKQIKAAVDGKRSSESSSSGSSSATSSGTSKSTESDPTSVDSIQDKLLAKIEHAMNLIKGINSLLSAQTWSAKDLKTSKEYFTDLPDGPFKNRLSEKMSAVESIKDQERQKNKETELTGLHDVIGNGFFNARNKEGTKAMLQLAAVQGNLDDSIKSLTFDDQKQAVKILTSGINFDNMSDSDKSNIAIASHIYENMSRSSDVDDDFDKKVVERMKEQSAKNLDSIKVDSESFYKGLKYSMHSEKEAAVTMARGIINGDIPASVLSKFNSDELNTLVRVVEKKGSTDEKNILLQKISESYTSGASVDITMLNKNDKAKIVKEYLASDKPDDSKLDTMIKNVGNSSIYELVNKEDLNDKQLSILAKRLDGDSMADNPGAAAKLLVAMIRSYNREQNVHVSLADINNFINEIDRDWWQDDDTMKKVIDMLGDGPESEYARFKALAPSALDKIYSISD